MGQIETFHPANDYRQACKASKQAQHPLLLCFTSASAADDYNHALPEQYYPLINPPTPRCF
ncbi:hypothetical protein T11_3131 [Trichinella zimbabwensis]|uniref:Uncharacterized protein n=1 Tax=Trichinella zimbabwensis TaxID=268475 RepID=A0A0V1HQL5_9BILA|nr:hypothetical protein T11_3131 [Trichinella zimbabwensis]